MKENTFFHRYKEIILGILMMTFASFYLYHSAFIKISARVKVNARMIPQALGTIVLVLGALQLAAGIRYLLTVREQSRRDGVAATFVGEEEKRSIVPILLTFATIGFYVATFEWLGFIISSSLCMFLQMRILSPKGKRKNFLFAVISVVIAVAVYIAFRRGLNLSLPQGILEDLRF